MNRLHVSLCRFLNLLQQLARNAVPMRRTIQRIGQCGVQIAGARLNADADGVSVCHFYRPDGGKG